MTDKAKRDELTESYDAALQFSIEAQHDAADAKAAVIAFDEQHPEVVRKFNADKGAAKVAMLGSTGTKVEAEGHATLAAAKGEGG